MMSVRAAAAAAERFTQRIRGGALRGGILKKTATLREQYIGWSSLHCA